MGGKHYYSFRYQANMLNIGHVDLTVDNAVLLDVWWNMLIKFSKQIGKSFSKTINGYLGEFEALSNIWDGAFRKS